MSSARTSSDPITDLLVRAAAAAAVPVTLVWATGQLAGRLWSGAWPDVHPGHALGVLLRLPGRLDDPARAWPAETQALLPGAMEMYGTLVALFLALVGLAGVGVWGWMRALERWDERHARRRGADLDEGTHWATASDLKPLRVRRPEPGRLTLGYADGHLIAAEPTASIAVLGPEGSGKTVGLAIPAILEWDGPVIAVSVKGDLEAATRDHRAGLGEVWRYDPTAVTGQPSARWSPLPGCTSWPDAKRVAAWLTSAAGTEETGIQGAAFWAGLNRMLLAPLLYAAANTGRSMTDVVRWVKTREQDEVRAALAACGEPAALEEAESSWSREAKMRESVCATVETVLEAFADPDVAATTGGCDIEAHRLLDGRANTLYVCAPGHEQERLRPLFVALLEQLLTAGYERVHQTGAPLDPPLLVVLDEAANIAPLRNLDRYAATCRAMGIQLVTVWQDLSQIHERYGRQRAATILNNHRGVLALSGIKDPATLDYLSTLTGEHDITQVSSSTNAAGEQTTTESTRRQDLATKAALRHLARGHALAIYGHHPPIRLQLRNSAEAVPTRPS